MGKKKSRVKQRNLNKQLHQGQDDEIILDPAYDTSPGESNTTNCNKNDLVGEKIVDPLQEESNSTAVGKEQENIVGDPTSEKQSQCSIVQDETITLNTPSENNFSLIPKTITEPSSEASATMKDPAQSSSNELGRVSTTGIPQTTDGDSNSSDIESRHESNVKDSVLETEKEHLISSTETKITGNSLKESIPSNDNKFSQSSISTSVATNDPVHCSTNYFTEGNAVSLPHTINRDVNSDECKSIPSGFVSETEKESLRSSGETISTMNSLEKSIPTEPNEYSGSSIGTPVVNKASEVCDSKDTDGIQTTESRKKTRDSNLANAESEQNSSISDSSSKKINECPVPSKEVTTFQSLPAESIDLESKRLPESSLAVSSNELKCNVPEVEIMTNIPQVPIEEPNLLKVECEQQETKTDTTSGTESKCSVTKNETTEINYALEEPNKFSDSPNIPSEKDKPILVQAKENPTAQTKLSTEQQVSSQKNSKVPTVSNTNFPEDEVPNKSDTRKTNRKNKRSGSNKNKATLRNSPTINDNDTNKTNTTERDTNQPTSLQSDCKSSTAFKEQSEKRKSAVVDVNLVQKASNAGEVVTNIEGVNTDGETHLSCEEAPQKQARKEEKEIIIPNDASSIQVNPEEDMTSTSMAKEICTEYIKATETNTVSCIENEQNENIPIDSKLLDVQAQNLTDTVTCSTTNPVSEKQHLSIGENSDSSATKTDTLASTKISNENDFPTKAHISTKEPDEVKEFAFANESKSAKLDDDNISQVVTSNTPDVKVSQAKEKIAQNSEKPTMKPNPEGCQKTKLEEGNPLPVSPNKKEANSRKNSRSKNGAKSEKPSSKSHAHPEKTVSDTKSNTTIEENMLDSFVNSNMDTMLSKIKTGTLTHQKKEGKINVQCNQAEETNAARTNKNLKQDSAEKQDTEIRVPKNKTKGANNRNKKKDEDSGVKLTSDISFTNVEKTNEPSSENRSVNQIERGKFLANDLLEGSNLLHAEETFPARTVFMANTCHVCKSTHGGMNRLKSCSACRLIAYCSKEHQRMHWKEHKSLCKVVQNMIKQSGLPDLFGDAYKIKDPEEWRKYRCYHLVESEKYLGRALLPYEREMFLYPRVCSLCHKSDPEKLKVCKVCHYINYCCSEHVPNTHNIWCDKLKLLLEINQYQSRHGLIKPCMPHINLDRNKPFPRDMKDLISVLLSREQNTTSFRLYEAALSDIASYPLTILYVTEYLKQENFKNISSHPKLTIHLVGAENQFEADTLSKWDTFLLNLLPHLSQLHLVFIGPELMPNEISEMKHSNYKKMNCKTIDPSKKIVTEFYYGKLYHEYVKEKTYSKPDIICAFNCGIYRFTGFDNQDTWGPTLSTMVKNQDTPVLLTAYTAVEAPKDVERFTKECAVKVLMPPTKNPFASMKPNLNFVSDDETPLIYKNQYLSIIIKGSNEHSNQ